MGGNNLLQLPHITLLVRVSHGELNETRFFTSDLRAARETDRHRWSGGVGGGVLGLSHAIGLVDALGPAELPVLC